MDWKVFPAVVTLPPITEASDGIGTHKRYADKAPVSPSNRIFMAFFLSTMSCPTLLLRCNPGSPPCSLSSSIYSSPPPGSRKIFLFPAKNGGKRSILGEPWRLGDPFQLRWREVYTDRHRSPLVVGWVGEWFAPVISFHSPLNHIKKRTASDRTDFTEKRVEAKHRTPLRAENRPGG